MSDSVGEQDQTQKLDSLSQSAQKKTQAKIQANNSSNQQLEANEYAQQESKESSGQALQREQLSNVEQYQEQKSPKSDTLSSSDIKSFLLDDSQITSMEQLLKFQKKAIQALKTHLYLQQVDTCQKLINHYRTKLQKSIDSSSLKTLQQAALEKLHQFNKSNQTISVQRDIAQIQRVISEMNDTSGYHTEKKKQYTMHYRKGEDKSLTLKFQALVQIPLFNLLTLFYETQLFPLWFPYCKSALCIHQYTKSKKLSQLVWKSPGPIADREAFIVGFGFNCLEYRQTILIMAKSVNQLKQFNGVKIPHQDNGRVKLQNKFFGFQIKPISEKLTRVRSIMSFNPNISWMPQKIIDILTKYFAKDLFEKMMKYALNFKGTVFERQLEKKRETQFYKWIGIKVKQYFVAMKEERDKKQRNKIQAW